MFDDVGGKLQGFAIVFCWIGIVASVISGFVSMLSGGSAIFIGILTMGLGSLVSWISSLVLYGFGHLIENTDILVANKENITFSTVQTQNVVAKNEKIVQLKDLKEKGLITEIEYEQKLKEIEGEN